MSRRLPTELLVRLQTAAAREGAALVFLEGAADRSLAVALAGDAVRSLWENPDYIREVAQVETTAERTPPQGRAAGLLAELRAALAAAELPAHAAARVSRRAGEAPALAVLATPGDAPSDWLGAGQALGEVLLRADASGVEASFLNELSEEPASGGRFKPGRVRECRRRSCAWATATGRCRPMRPAVLACRSGGRAAEIVVVKGW